MAKRHWTTKVTVAPLEMLWQSTTLATYPEQQRNGRRAMTSEDEIRAKFHAGAEAWNRGDMAEYLSSYLDSDATRWVTGATVIRGKDAIVAAYRARFPSPDRMGNFEVAEIEVEFLGEADALVFGR